MAKPSPRRQDRRRQRQRKRDRLSAVANLPAPNLAADQVTAMRHGIALLTATHASPEDLPDLLDEFAGNLRRQMLLADALLAGCVGGSCRDLAARRGTTAAEELKRLTGELDRPQAVDPQVWRPAVDLVTRFERVLAGSVAANGLGREIRARMESEAAREVLSTLTGIAHAAIVLRCAEFGQDVSDYLRRISLPYAEAHGNQIDADVAEAYIYALVEQRLDSEPQLLARAAAALRGGPASLPAELAVEFAELGGTERLEALADTPWQDLKGRDRRLVLLALLDRAYVDPGGATVADRIQVRWRF